MFHLNVKANTCEEDSNHTLKKQKTSFNIPNKAKLFEELLHELTDWVFKI